MNEPDNHESPPSTSRWPRRLLTAACLLLGLVGLLLGYIWYLGHAGETKLKETLAELDRTDPGWRWDQIQQARAAIPDEANSALHVLHVRKLLPRTWGDSLDEALRDITAELELSDRQAALLESELAALAPALEEARRLADMPTGRFPITLDPNPLHFFLEHVQEARAVTRLLAFDAIAQAHNKNGDAACLAVHAGLNASRAISDEPTLISQLVRIACRSIPIRRLERVLAQCEASEAALARLQLALEADEPAPIFLYAVRGERAFSERLFHALENNPKGMPPNFLQELASVTSSEKYKIGEVDFEVLAARFFEEGTSGQFADLFRQLTEAVEIARRPPEEQRAAVVALEATVATKPRIVRAQMPAITKVHEACLRVQAEMRAAIAALAAERFRLAHGRWPESFQDLVNAKLLSKIPVDPYTKDPFHLQRVSDGVIIYGVGLDGNDDGGKLVRGDVSQSSDHDVGFRLWDVKHRRQPPRAVPPGE